MDGVRRLSAVMFTDIQGYTELVARDEELALDFVRKHRSALTDLTARHGGEVVEFYGDGSLSVYDSAVEAVQCAIEMQSIYRGAEEVIPVRIGIHLGDIVRRDGSIFGNGVNIASRIESIGVAGNVLISGQVEAELQNQNSISSKYLGKFRFKNVKEDLSIYAVQHPDLVLPNKRRLGGIKGKRVKSSMTRYMAALFLIILIAAVYFARGLFTHSTEETVSSKIAVPPFQNFTGIKDFDFIGDMTAHWLTKELMHTETANVLAFYSNEEIEELAIASTSGNINQIFAEQQGAINILDGTYVMRSPDSIEFSVFIRHLHNGEVEHAFRPVVFLKDQPSEGISALAALVKGYWESQSEKLLSVPIYDSYKKYIQARNLNNKNDSLARVLALESIHLDSAFLDPYFLLLGNYLNNGLYQQATRLVHRLDLMTSELTPFEKNILDYSRADLNGKNKLTYEIAMKDEQAYDRDFFTMTDYLVYALGYVNNPDKTIALFNKYDFEKLDLSRCSYCSYSHMLAIAAYIRLGKHNKALELINRLPASTKGLFYYSLYIKLAATSGDIQKLETVVNEARKNLDEDAAEMVYYIASRELTLVGAKKEANQYAEMLVNDRPNRADLMGWGYYFTGELDSALVAFENAYDEDRDNTTILGQVGLIHAKKGAVEQARNTIDELTLLKGAYQFGAVPYAKARIFLALDRKDEALESLQKAYEEGAKFSINNTFEQDVDLMPLLPHPTYQSIVHPISNR